MIHAIRFNLWRRKWRGPGSRVGEIRTGVPLAGVDYQERPDLAAIAIARTITARTRFVLVAARACAVASRHSLAKTRARGAAAGRTTGLSLGRLPRESLPTASRRGAPCAAGGRGRWRRPAPTSRGRRRTRRGPTSTQSRKPFDLCLPHANPAL